MKLKRKSKSPLLVERRGGEGKEGEAGGREEMSVGDRRGEEKRGEERRAGRKERGEERRRGGEEETRRH